MREDQVARRASRARSVQVVSACSWVSAWIVVAAVAVQAQPPQGRGGRGQITSPRNAYPDRTPGDPAAIERGRALYGVNCAFCHGPDTRGGDSGPSLLRFGIVLDDRNGEMMAPVIRNGRTDQIGRAHV